MKLVILFKGIPHAYISPYNSYLFMLKRVWVRAQPS